MEVDLTHDLSRSRPAAALTGELSRAAVLSMFLSAACFAAMATLVGLVHRLQPSVSTAMVSSIRAAVNLLILVALAWRSPRDLLGDGRLSLWMRGVFGAVALLAYFGSLSRIGVGEAYFLNQTSTVWLAVLAPVILREKSGRWTWLAITGSLVGMFLLSYPRVGISHDSIGRVLGALSGLLAGLAYVSIRRAGSTNGSLVIVFYFTLVATVLSIGLVLLEPVVWPAGASVWLTLVAVGIFATAAQLLLTHAYRSGPAAPVSVVAYAGPLLTSLLGWLVLQQRPDGISWIGMALILACGVTLPFLFAQKPT